MGEIKVTHRVAFAAGQWVFEAGPFKAGDHTQLFQRIIRRHQLG